MKSLYLITDIFVVLQNKYLEIFKKVLCYIPSNSYHLSPGIPHACANGCMTINCTNKLSIAFGFNDQILKLLNQNYPCNYQSEHYCCGELDLALIEEVNFKICISVYRQMILPLSNI